MTTLKELRQYCNEKIGEYPSLANDINDSYALCLAEIEDGGSVIAEISYCVENIKELIEELQN